MGRWVCKDQAVTVKRCQECQEREPIWDAEPFFLERNDRSLEAINCKNLKWKKSKQRA